MVREHRGADIDGIAVDYWQETGRFVLYSWRFDGGGPLQGGGEVGITSLVQQIRRERGSEVQCSYSGIFPDLSRNSSRPGCCVVVIAIVALANPRSAQSMFLAEVVIDLDVDLLTIVSVDDFSGT